ncbi:MAG: hypothetical protein RLZZ118_645 [Bacteroidota bacterium]|jgi:predicted AAA+ superfamily ATPase
MIKRELHTVINNKLFKGKVILLFGARQVGKSTLIHQVLNNASDVLWLNADDVDVIALFENINATRMKKIIGANKIIVIDEAQSITDIGKKLKIMHDQIEGIQIIATGSSAFELKNKTNEPLTGRKWEYHLYPFSFQELANATNILEEKRMLKERLVMGAYPEIVVNNTDEEERLKLLTESYLYKDILKWNGIQKPEKLVHLLKLLAYQIGAEVSYNKLSNELGLDHVTIEKYIILLEQCYVIFRLHAYSTNHAKELKKSRKIFFYDNGIRNAIIGDFGIAENRQDIGKLWENYIIAEMFKKLQYQNKNFEMYFWRTHDQQEIDLIVKQNNIHHAFEIKWNPNRKAKLSKTFSSLYTEHTFQVIHPENYDEILMDEN